ncbi:voltage-dependent anion channel [Microdochium bolleyi]|uniref:Voltage-dependent anion channel n=1 Tax=Microdochium bolleyi TaxID=196109 RepID=A0A136IZZ0_9PEZI|nr:voltage-dependent anion channel [Microdochium bolleyi]
MASDRSDSSGTLAEPPRNLALRNFGSVWFIIPQGTGILALCFWQSHYQFHGLNSIALVAWALTIVQLLLVFATYLVRLVRFPRYVATQLATNNSEVACIASFPVVLTSIVQMLGLVLGHQDGWSTASYVLWWIVFGLSVVIVVIIPQTFATTHPPGIDKLLPNSQLPIVAALTAAAAGGALCESTSTSLAQQLPVIAVSYLLVGVGVPLAIFMDAIFLARLFNQTKEGQQKENRLQKQMLAYQTMICAGPWGQSSVALLTLGKVVLTGGLGQSAASVVGNELAARSVAYISIFVGFLFWGHATFWWIFTLLSIAHSVAGRAAGSRRIQFQMPMWSLVFPWGVYTNGAIQLGKLLDSTVFHVWSAILTILMTIIWLSFTAMTIKGCLDGSILGLEHGWRSSPPSNNESDEEHAMSHGRRRWRKEH